MIRARPSLPPVASAAALVLTLTACGDDGASDPFATGGTSAAGSTGSAATSAGTSTGANSAGATSAATTGGSGAASSGGPKFDVGDTAGATTTAGDGGGGGGCARMDILFIMDISASMDEETKNLKDNFDAFVQVLDDHVAANNGFGSYRIGVTNSSMNRNVGGCTTTMGFDGALFDGDGGCGLGPDPWIEGPSPNAKTQFACLAGNPIPSGGGVDCGHELPLEVTENFGAKLAAGQPNEGFYDKNDNSLLVLVVPTDEDEDADSMTNPAQTKAYLDQLAGGAERYGVVVIAGPGPGDCMGMFGDAQEATLLKSFADLVPNGFFGSICQGDLALTLATALQDMVVSCDELPPPEG